MKKLFIFLILLVYNSFLLAAPGPPYIPPFDHSVYTKQLQSGTGAADQVLSLTTAATGTNWTAFASAPCSTLLIINDTGTKLSVRLGGAGNALPVPDGSGLKVNVNANANEVSVRRADTSNTPVTVSAAASK